MAAIIVCDFCKQELPRAPCDGQIIAGRGTLAFNYESRVVDITLLLTNSSNDTVQWDICSDCFKKGVVGLKGD